MKLQQGEGEAPAVKGEPDFFFSFGVLAGRAPVGGRVDFFSRILERNKESRGRHLENKTHRGGDDPPAALFPYTTAARTGRWHITPRRGCVTIGGCSQHSGRSQLSRATTLMRGTHDSITATTRSMHEGDPVHKRPVLHKDLWNQHITSCSAVHRASDSAEN